jgi:hypothetical protein
MLKKAGVKVTEDFSPVAKKERVATGKTPFSEMKAVGGIRAKGIDEFIPMVELRKFPDGTINFSGDGVSGQTFEDFVFNLIEEGSLYPELSIQMANGRKLDNDMIQVVVDDIRANKWSKVEKGPKRVDRVELQQFEEQASEDAKADEISRKALDLLILVLF